MGFCTHPIEKLNLKILFDYSSGNKHLVSGKRRKTVVHVILNEYVIRQLNFKGNPNMKNNTVNVQIIRVKIQNFHSTCNDSI